MWPLKSRVNMAVSSECASGSLDLAMAMKTSMLSMTKPAALPLAAWRMVSMISPRSWKVGEVGDGQHVGERTGGGEEGLVGGNLEG